VSEKEPRDGSLSTYRIGHKEQESGKGHASFTRSKTNAGYGSLEHTHL